MECRELTERVLERLTRSGTDDAELDRHLAGCPSCRAELVALEDSWDLLGLDPDREVTPEFRARTVELLEDEIARRRIREFRPRSRAIVALARAAALLVAVAAGFFGARAFPAKSVPALATGGAPAPAATAPDLSGKPKLSNVAYRTAPDGRVGIEFDTITRHSVVGRPDEPHVSSLIAYLLSASSETAAARSRAIELVSGNFPPDAVAASPEIVRALAGTLKRDTNPGVRKKAAEALASFRSSPEIRSALLDALANDANPGVRLVAVDALATAAREEPDPRTIETLREKAFDPSENGFVRARAASALKAIDL